MNYKILMVIGWLLTGVLVPVFAEDEQPFTLQAAVRLAVTHNPQLKAARSQLDIRDAAIKTAGARLNPVLMSDNGIAEGTSRVGLEQTIELGGKRQHRIALAKAQREEVLWQYTTALLDLQSDVRRAYTQLYSAQERKKSYQNILQVTQELVGIAKKREQAGDIAQLDVLQTEILSVNAQNDLQTVEKELVLSRNRLNALLRQPLDTTVALAPPDTTPRLGTAQSIDTPQQQSGSPVLKGELHQWTADLESLIQAAYRNRPELKRLNQSLVISQRELAVAKANRIPNLTLTAGPDIVYKNLNNTANQTSVFITGTFEIPVFNRQQGPIQEQLAREIQVRQEMEALKNNIALEVTNAYSAYEVDVERIQRYEKTLLPYSVAVVDKSRRAFQVGKTSIVLPINAQQAYINTRLGYLQALQDAQNDISDLERAIGAGL